MTRLAGRVAGKLASPLAGNDGSDADALADGIRAVTDSQLVHGYLVADQDRFRTMGAGGVSALHDFVGSNDFEQSTASQQPALDIGGAPRERDRITFDDTSSQFMQLASNVNIAAGSRWGVLSVEQHVSTKTITNQRIWVNGSAERIFAYRSATPQFGAGFFVGAAWDFVTQGTADTDPHVLEAYCANPHSVWMDGSESTSAGTAGLDGGSNQPWCIGGSSAGYGYMDMHLSLFLIVRLSGSSLPSWLPTVRTLIDNYYGGQWGL